MNHDSLSPSLLNKPADPSLQVSPEPRAAVHACNFEAEAERLHIAICQAVILLNNGDTLKGHTILRETLAGESRVTAPVGQCPICHVAGICQHSNPQVKGTVCIGKVGSASLATSSITAVGTKHFAKTADTGDAISDALASPPQIAQPERVNADTLLGVYSGGSLDKMIDSHKTAPVYWEGWERVEDFVNGKLAALAATPQRGEFLDLQLVEDALFMAAAVDANSDRAERMQELGERIYKLKIGPPGAEASPAVVEPQSCEECEQENIPEGHYSVVCHKPQCLESFCHLAWQQGMEEALRIFGDSITWTEASRAIPARIKERAEAYASCSRAGKP